MTRPVLLPLFAAALLAAVAGCSGTGGHASYLPSRSIAAAAAAAESLDDTPDRANKIAVSKKKLVFLGVGESATVSVDERGYSGVLAAKSSSAKIAIVKPGTIRDGKGNFIIQPVSGGFATITIRDVKGNSAKIKVYVNALSLLLQNVPSAAKSITFTAQSTRSTDFIAGSVKLNQRSKACKRSGGKTNCTVAIAISVGKKAGATSLTDVILLNFLGTGNNLVANVVFYAHVKQYARQSVTVPIATFAGFLPVAGSPQGSLTAGPPGDSRLWYIDLTNNNVDAVTAAGLLSSYAQPTVGGNANENASIVPGAAGTLWFAGDYFSTGTVNSIATAGTVAQYPATPAVACSPSPFFTSNVPLSMAHGSDGNIWYLESIPNSTCGTNAGIGVTSPGGADLHDYPLATAGGNSLYFTQSLQHEIVTGSDGALWFWLSQCAPNDSRACTLPNVIGHITTGGVISYYPLSVVTGCADGYLANGGDGNVWFATPCVPAGAPNAHTTIGRITPSGAITLFYGQNVWALGNQALDLAEGPDGNLYVPEQGQFGRIVTTGAAVGQIDEYGLPPGKGGAYMNSMATGPDGFLYATDCGVCAGYPLGKPQSFLDRIAVP